MKTSSRPSSSPPSPEPLSGAAPEGPTSIGNGPVAGRVDAHAHVFPAELILRRETYVERDVRFGALYRSPKAAMVTADELVESMDRHGLDMCVAVGFPFADQGLCRLVNDHLVEAVARFPGRLAGLACVAPDAPGARAELERCLDAGLIGCGELAPDHDAARLRAAGSPSGLGAVADCLRERGLPLMVHASEPLGHDYPGKGRFTPEACYALAEAQPGLTIVFGHMGGGLFLYEAMPEVRRTLVSCFYDTAAVPYLYGSEIYAACVLTAGPEKLIFGSDYPLLAPSRYQEGLAGLDPATRAAVEGGNARKVFGL